jgi:hypothetical protein
MSDALTMEERRQALALASGDLITGEESPQVLALAVELTQYRYTEQILTPEQYRERVFPLLKARSALGKVPAPEVQPPLSPSVGHGPQRIDLYGGISGDGDAFGGFRWRAAYHDILDDPRGYPAGSAITFFSLDVRHRGNAKGFRVEEGVLVDIRSLSPPELWVRPLSWAAVLKVEADPLDPDHHRTLGGFATGFAGQGFSEYPGYVMMSNQIRVDSNLSSGVGWEPGVQWGGFAGGTRLRVGLQGWHHFGVWGSRENRHHIGGELRSSFRVNRSVSIRADWFSESQGERSEFQVGLLQTF